jgi:hypothetical protein
VEEARQPSAVIYVGRFGHAAKVWLAIGVLLLAGFGWFAVTEPGAIFALAILVPLLAINLWFQVSQRVWYDDQIVATKIVGASVREIPFKEINEVTRDHSWSSPRSRPIDELRIYSRVGEMIPISLRHVNVADLCKLLDRIHGNTGLPVPSLRDLL